MRGAREGALGPGPDVAAGRALRAHVGGAAGRGGRGEGGALGGVAGRRERLRGEAGEGGGQVEVPRVEGARGDAPGSVGELRRAAVYRKNACSFSRFRSGRNFRPFSYLLYLKSGIFLLAPGPGAQANSNSTE